jgi:pilus assembly protein CpaB
VQYAQKLLSTRGGTITVSALAALLAGAIFLVYLRRYQSSVNESAQPMTVLVAKSLIEKGTPGAVLGAQDLYETTTVTRGDVHEGAFADPNVLKGRIAVDDIFPGEQLTTADFTTTTTDALATKLAEDQRAVSVPVDSAHGLVGKVEAGDHVDVFGGFNVRRLNGDGNVDPNAAERPVLKLLVEDVLVLEVPGKSNVVPIGGQQTSELTVRVTDEEAAKLAFASDNGKIWIALRPRTGAQPTAPDIVTLETVLFGVKPIAVERALGGRRQ